MVSDQFRKDYRQMIAQGVTFTPEDIIRLNALSVKTRRSSTAARDVFLPRLAFLPRDSWWRTPIVLREPTVAHDLWIEMAERWIDTSKDVNFLFLNAFALSRHPGKLPDPNKPRKVIREVYRFAAKRLSRLTGAQLHAAVEYALFGNCWTACEHGPETKKTDPGERERPSPTIGLLTDMRMIRLPITTDDAMRMTASELTEAINRAWDLDKKFDAQKSHAKAFGEYVRAREEIRARSTRGNDQRPSRGQEP